MTTGADLAEPLRRLLEALRTAAETGPGEPAADGEPVAGECKWCPHCQVLAVLRGDRPELTAALGDVLTTAVAALRQFSGETAPPAAEPTDEEAAPSGDPAPRVQRIDLR
jgi:hypothetical protein